MLWVIAVKPKLLLGARLAHPHIGVRIFCVIYTYAYDSSDRSARDARHLPVLTICQVRTFSLNYEGRSTLIWQTNYIPEDTSGEVAQRKRKLFASKYLTTVTGHSSSYSSRQSIRNPEDTRDILYSSLKKHILGNDNRALLTWYLVHMLSLIHI